MSILGSFVTNYFYFWNFSQAGLVGAPCRPRLSPGCPKNPWSGPSQQPWAPRIQSVLSWEQSGLQPGPDAPATTGQGLGHRATRATGDWSASPPPLACQLIGAPGPGSPGLGGLEARPTRRGGSRAGGGATNVQKSKVIGSFVGSYLTPNPLWTSLEVIV